MIISRKITVLTLAVVVSTATLIRMLNHLLPTADGTIGHDYRYFLPYLLSGVEWIHQNGWLTIPYFTPDYCGGIPWLASPQSIFYSVPQFLTLLINPVAAVYWTTIIFATIGAAASYRLLRKSFGVSWQAAALVFVLFQLSTFPLFRMAVGHVTYHIFGLIPVLCWLVLLPVAEGASAQIRVIHSAGAMIVGGILLAMMVYAGATNFVIPAVLSVVAVVLVHQARVGWQLAPWCKLVGAGLWAIPLSAIKLLPAFIFIQQFPRPYIPEYLFNGPIRLAKVLLASLFAPGLLPDYISPQFPMSESNWMGVHEFEYGVSIIPLPFLLAAVLLWARQPSRPQHLFAWIGLALVIALPIALTMGSDAWGQILLKIPVINNNTTFVRWWSIYITLVIVVTGLSFDRVVSDTRVRDVLLCGSISVVVAQLMLHDLSYYETSKGFPRYDPTAVIAAVERVSSGVPLPEISQIGMPTPDQSKTLPGSIGNNDGLIWGISAYPCYETVFGYRGYSGELFPARQLQVGPVKSEIDDHFNLVDPRCYLSSEACPDSVLFRRDDSAEVAKFTSHRPLPWLTPWQRFAEAATIVSAFLSALALISFVIAGMVRWEPRTPIKSWWSQSMERHNFREKEDGRGWK
jgi:hypothetical protein